MTAPSDFNSIPELDATLVFRVAYDGSSYSGFAEQPGQTTVAGELRRAIETLLRRPIDLTCAGRTDAGVHAVAQYISVPVTDAELALTRRRWLRAMDALLPKDIAINEVYRARKGFSARFDARSRTYTYRIADRDARPVLSRGAVWWHRYPLDVEAMSAACPALLGEQDFKSFCKVASAVGKPTHRCVMRAEFGHEVAFGEDILTFTIEGNAFLHSMVRTIVGTLVEIGMHRREPEWMREVIDACEPFRCGPHGSCLRPYVYGRGLRSRRACRARLGEGSTRRASTPVICGLHVCNICSWRAIQPVSHCFYCRGVP